MPIWRLSATSSRIPLALTMLIFAPAGLLAQVSEPTANARETVAAEGNAALDRIERAAAARKQDAEVRGPAALPTPSPEVRRRAFDGLRRRAHLPAIDNRARAALDKGKETMATERDAMAHRIGQALGLEAPEMAAIAGVAAPPDTKGWVPVLFVSSSMPVTTLRNYAVQLERVGGVLAFRGMPGGMRKVAPMAKLSAQVLRLDPGCEGPACAMRAVQLIVDPLIFRQHGVARVPALAMVPGDPAQPYCERENESPRSVHVIYGDAALSGLLEEYARLGGKQEVSDAQSRLQAR